MVTFWLNYPPLNQCPSSLAFQHTVWCVSVCFIYIKKKQCTVCSTINQLIFLQPNTVCCCRNWQTDTQTLHLIHCFPTALLPSQAPCNDDSEEIILPVAILISEVLYYFSNYTIAALFSFGVRICASWIRSAA